MFGAFFDFSYFYQTRPRICTRERALARERLSSRDTEVDWRHTCSRYLFALSDWARRVGGQARGRQGELKTSRAHGLCAIEKNWGRQSSRVTARQLKINVFFEKAKQRGLKSSRAREIEQRPSFLRKGERALRIRLIPKFFNLSRYHLLIQRHQPTSLRTRKDSIEIYARVGRSFAARSSIDKHQGWSPFEIYFWKWEWPTV